MNCVVDSICCLPSMNKMKVELILQVFPKMQSHSLNKFCLKLTQIFFSIISTGIDELSLTKVTAETLGQSPKREDNIRARNQAEATLGV